MNVNCQAPDCGALTDAWLCTSCALELKLAIKALPGLMHETSLLATGQTRVYRAARRAVPTDEELADVEEEYAWRLALIPTHLRSRDGRVTLPATRAVVNLAARDRLDQAWTTLTTWARHLLETRGSREQPGSTPAQVAAWLADRVNAIRHDEAAEQAFTELTRLREQLTRLVDRAPSRIYAGPCHVETDAARCDRPLYAWFSVWQASRDEPGEDERVVVCDGYRPPGDKQWDPADEGCGAEHTPADRAEWIIAEMDDRLDTLAFWQQWLPLLLPALTWPNRSTWWRWVNPPRGQTARLVAKSLTRDAEELFRGGDIIDLVEREQARIRGNIEAYSRKRERTA